MFPKLFPFRPPPPPAEKHARAEKMIWFESNDPMKPMVCVMPGRIVCITKCSGQHNVHIDGGQVFGVSESSYDQLVQDLKMATQGYF
jgi:hypothetical protein